jgi:hypothetical protein
MILINSFVLPRLSGFMSAETRSATRIPELLDRGDRLMRTFQSLATSHPAIRVIMSIRFHSTLMLSM